MSLDDDLATAFDGIVHDRGYENRSEAFRDLLRKDLIAGRVQTEPATPCVATLSYVYDHHQRQLSSRLADLQHDHHDLAISTLHAHLNHDWCIETMILRGEARDIHAFAQAIITQPGVLHGQLNLVPWGIAGIEDVAPPGTQLNASQHAD